MCFDVSESNTCVPVAAGSIDTSYCFLQAANRLSAVLGYFRTTTSSYLNVKVLQQAVSCMYHFFDNFCPFGPDTNPNAFALVNALTANISTLPASLNCSNIAGLGITQTNEVIDYIRHTNASDITNSTVANLVNNVIQNGFQNMCEGDYISPIVNALIDYNGASTPADYTFALSEIAEAILSFNSFQSGNIAGNLMDGYTSALYLFLNTPVGKIGAENPFTLFQAADAANGPSYNQLNLALVELGENNQKCLTPLVTTSNSACGGFMQTLVGCALAEFNYRDTDCVTNPNGLACGCTNSSCGFNTTCNTGCKDPGAPAQTIGTCTSECIPVSSGCKLSGLGVCATCPAPTTGPNTWYDQANGWQSGSASNCQACNPSSNTTSTKKGGK